MLRAGEESLERGNAVGGGGVQHLSIHSDERLDGCLDGEDVEDIDRTWKVRTAQIFQ